MAQILHPVWLWLAAVALIRPLVWEPPYDLGAALKSKQTNKQKTKKPSRIEKKKSEIKNLLEEFSEFPCGTVD